MRRSYDVIKILNTQTVYVIIHVSSGTKIVKIAEEVTE